MNKVYSEKRIEAYVNKFLADNGWNVTPTNVILEKTYKNCVIPAPVELYEQIKIKIEEAREARNNGEC